MNGRFASRTSRACSNVDIVDAKWASIGHSSSLINLQLAITHAAHPVVVSNVSWRNITFDNSNGAQRIAVTLPLGGARIERLLFDGIRAPRGNFSAVSLAGHSPADNIDGVLFRDVYLGGRLLTAQTAAADGMTTQFATNVRFERS